MIHPEDAPRILSQLEGIGESLGVKVRYERFDNSGDNPNISSGYCRLRGTDLLLIDSRLSVEARCHLLAKELKRFDLDNLFIPPGLRLIIQGREGDF